MQRADVHASGCSERRTFRRRQHVHTGLGADDESLAETPRRAGARSRARRRPRSAARRRAATPHRRARRRGDRPSARCAPASLGERGRDVHRQRRRADAALGADERETSALAPSAPSAGRATRSTAALRSGAATGSVHEFADARAHRLEHHRRVHLRRDDDDAHARVTPLRSRQIARQRRPAPQIHHEHVGRLALTIDAGRARRSAHSPATMRPAPRREHRQLPVRRFDYGDTYRHNVLFLSSSVTHTHVVPQRINMICLRNDAWPATPPAPAVECPSC